MDDYHLTSTELASLKKFYRTLHDKREADRIKAVIALGNGWAIGEVSAILLLEEQTVRSYFLKYKESGESNLIQMNYSGKEPLLNEKQLAELSQHLDENIYLSSNNIIDYVFVTYGVKYSCTGMKYLLRRLGFLYKRPKHVPDELDAAPQTACLDKYKKLKKTKGKNDPICSVDGCSPQFNGGWIRRGEEKEL